MTTDNIVTGSAIGAVASPWWLLIVHGVSASCAAVLPVLGVILLVMQITDRLEKKRKNSIDCS